MILYQITNTVNGKRYIGKTSRSLSVRWSQHQNCAKQQTPRFLIHKALRKYGTDSFIVELVYTAESEEELSLAEMAFIYALKTQAPSGYNLTCGGEGAMGATHWIGRKHTLETRQKMSFNSPHTRIFGRKPSTQTRQKISESKMGNTVWLGRKHSPEAHQHMREAQGSPEARLRMSALLIGRPKPRKAS
jgi:group I intron endonuclease